MISLISDLTNNLLFIQNLMDRQNPCCAVEVTIASSRQRMVQSFLLILLDTSIDQSKKDSQDVLAQLRSVTNDVNCFTQPVECVDFLTDINGMKGSLIVSNALGQQIVPLIHDVPQLHGIYIFPSCSPKDEQWTQQ